MAWEHAPEPTTQSTNNAAILLCCKKIQKPIPTEAEKHLKYDLKELREHPEKLTNAYREYIERNKKEQDDKHDWREWGGYHKTLGKILAKTYPLKQKQTEAMEPNWILLMEKWGTQEEREITLNMPTKKEMRYKKK